MVRRVLAMVPPASDGQAAPIYVLDRDGRLPLDSDWGGRVRLFQGSEADAAFLASRRSRIECALPECVATVLDGERRYEPRLRPVCVRLRLSSRRWLLISVATLLAGRPGGVDWWRDRFGLIIGGGSRRAGRCLSSRLATRRSSGIRQKTSWHRCTASAMKQPC